MDKDNLNFTISSDDLSVEAILAEYEAENGIIKRGIEMPREEPSRPLTMDVSQSDTIGSAEIKSKAENYEPSPESKTPLTDMLRRLESERSISSTPEFSPKYSDLFADEVKPSMSVEEIMLMADIEGITREDKPSVSMDDIFERPEKSQIKNRSFEESVKTGGTNNFPTKPSSSKESQQFAPADDLNFNIFEHSSSTSEPAVEIEKSSLGQERKSEIGEEPVSAPTFSEAEEDTSIPTDPEVDSEKEDKRTTMQRIFPDNNPFSPTGDSFEEEKSISASNEKGYASASSEINDNADGAEYADSGEYDSNVYADDKERDYSGKPEFKEKLLAPLIAIIAYSAAKREKRRAEAQARREAMQKDEFPELPADKAALLYAQQSSSLKFRCIFATVLTLILVYLSYGLPTTGLLSRSPTILALVCMIFELTVMLVGLDIFTNGMTSLMRGEPGAESLISVSAIVSMIDAIYIAATGNTEIGLPFCGVSALSMTFALWGSKISCESFAISFFVASQAENPTVILSEAGIDEGGCALSKSNRPVTGFVRTAESADIFENAYKLFAPVLIIGSLILSLFCYIVSGSCNSFIHTLGASISICASLYSFLGFALPFSVITKRLARSRVAIAGYGGCAELGRIHRIVITDSDIFPARTISISDISIAQGLSPQKVISYTSSMISASGMCSAPVFTQLMRKNGCVMQKVEDFACHEGGGIIARINGDHVYVGTAAFMRLMGVRIPKDAAGNTVVFTAINNSLAGFFSMNYTAVASVQRALVNLLSGNNDPIFAIRDFNITPLLLKQKFRLPSAVYDFPSFADRYRLSSPEYEDKGNVSAMYSLGGLSAVAGLSKRGRKLYIALRICSVISVLGSIIGMVLILALCWSGAYDSASCGNIMTYMLLWLIPLFVISFGLRK